MSYRPSILLSCVFCNRSFSASRRLRCLMSSSSAVISSTKVIGGCGAPELRSPYSTTSATATSPALVFRLRIRLFVGGGWGGLAGSGSITFASAGDRSTIVATVPSSWSAAAPMFEASRLLGSSFEASTISEERQPKASLDVNQSNCGAGKPQHRRIRY